jgi:hypothetical protein
LYAGHDVSRRRGREGQIIDKWAMGAMDGVIIIEFYKIRN